MALRIADHVAAGELDNTVRGRVTGWIKLAGRDELLQLNLQGDCHPDLAGWRFRIVRTDPIPEWAEPIDHDSVFSDQNGQVGDITADQVLKHHECSAQEVVARINAGEPPPFEWRKSLYLEWFSERNGRVVIQDTRLAVERIGERAFELTKEDLKRQAEQAEAEYEQLLDDGIIEEIGPGITMIRPEGSDGDPADDLQSQLDRQSREIERSIRDSLDQDQSDA